MKVAVASDHAGYRLKTVVAEWLEENGHEVLDLGTDSEESVDYPPFCAAAARAVVEGEADRGIVLGGSGQGEAIAANKVRGARAALCHNEWTARMARQHNDANVLAMGARLLADAYALVLVEVFLSTDFDGGRHENRIDQLRDIENEECDSGDGG
ncbi:MAG TPA: ribose-5-phosphate isomerase [Acidimicrobiales bacterium]|jgi:ribose 5-phosphate isomerase B|nr:ribose-5-phosphate isomerase [Acidimicrobiales bacterium]